MSKNREEVVSELENQANESNEKLSETLQQLFHEVQPATQLDALKAKLKYRLEEAGYVTMTTIDEARAGDKDAQQQVLKGVAVGAGAIGLLMLRRVIRRHFRR